MFESFSEPTIAERFRRAAIPPLAAFLAAMFYLAIYPMFGRVPAALFWLVDLILLAGAVAGFASAIRIVRAHRQDVRGVAIGWLVVCCAISLVCAWFFLTLTFPWI